MFASLKKLLHGESAGGFLLLLAAIAALILANSPLAKIYDLLIALPVEIRIGPLYIAKPLLLWINDGLMAIFFLLVGLELKREFFAGQLSDPRNLVLPAAGALGGMLVPAFIYFLVNRDDPVAMSGWAIPMATDIAFALGVVSLLGSRVPAALKLFLVSLAIFDDIGAILIIALFYSDNLSMEALLVASCCLLLLTLINRRGVTSYSPYLLVGIVMWIALLKSGVHATLTGILLAFFIPWQDPNRPHHSPLTELEHDLHGAVSLGILPLFAFANSGIPLWGIEIDSLLHPVTLGIILGLFVGKQLGVFGFCWLAIKLKLAQLPTDSDWRGLYGIALLSGVGFTMSLFIGSLAFENSGDDLFFDERLGIIIGSLLSALAGYLVLKRRRGPVP